MIDMERKIGEIFEFGDEWYQCLKEISCKECDFSGNNITCDIHGAITCTRKGRSDDTSVVFKKLDKIGEPYTLENKKFQKYRVFHTPYIYNKVDCSWQSFADPYYVSLEISSTKEDMEEKTIKIKKEDIKVGSKVIYLPSNRPYVITEVNCRMKYDGDWHDCVIYTPLYDNPYKCFVRPIKDFAQNFVLDSAEEKEEKYSNLESTGKDLKPFDLQKAKEGKPVCTRDGRNVRILGFDAKGRKPISALVESRDGKDEEIVSYTNEGKFYIDCTWSNDLDLVMCQEKGIWVARDRDGSLHGYDEIPYKDEKNGNWYGYGKCRSVRILIWDMPEVRWEDEKPKKLIIK